MIYRHKERPKVRYTYEMSGSAAQGQTGRLQEPSRQRTSATSSKAPEMIMKQAFKR
jgi:hypothetical protein